MSEDLPKGKYISPELYQEILTWRPIGVFGTELVNAIKNSPSPTGNESAYANALTKIWGMTSLSHDGGFSAEIREVANKTLRLPVKKPIEMEDLLRVMKEGFDEFVEADKADQNEGGPDEYKARAVLKFLQER